MTTNPAALVLLRSAALLYTAAVRLRNLHYDRPETIRRVSIPVVSVGNLTVGGTGKTPLVSWLANHLLGQGRRPAVVSRGYGGRAGRGPLVVSSGDGPRCVASRCGDEPFLLAQTLPGVAVVVGSDRVAGAGEAARLGSDVVLLDDGFQHRRLARDLDIVLLDASNPFGNYELLPAGLLREPVSGLSRADIIIITRSRENERFDVIERAVRHHNVNAPILHAGHRTLGFFDSNGQVVERPRRVVAFCGIGNPSRFRMDLRSEGIELVEFRSHRDHHPYSERELRDLRERALSTGAALVTTQKDLVRIGPGNRKRPELPPILTLRIEAVVHDPEPLLQALQGIMGVSSG